MSEQIITIDQEKKRLRSEFEKGTTCRCCGQKVKQYKRKLNSGMCVFLIGLFKLSKRGMDNTPFSAAEVLESMGKHLKSTDYSMLQHFGLIQKKESGWVITEDGICFCVGGSCPKYIYTFNGHFLGRSEQRTSLCLSIGDKFNLAELMS